MDSKYIQIIMQIAGLVILFNPDHEFIKCIESYLPHLNKLFIADNSSKSNYEKIQSYLPVEKITYIWNGENKGIAARINEAAHVAINYKFDWLLTMDQDSQFDEDSFIGYCDCIDKYVDKNQVAVFGITYEKREKIPVEDCTAVEISQLITSGSIINLCLLEKIGAYNNDLFIDQVDFEYCYRSLRMGYKIIQFENVFSNHKLGNSSIHTSLKTFKYTTRSLHSAHRMYYMVRNYLYIQRNFKDFEKEIKLSRQDILTRIKNNMLYNRNRFETLKYILLGIIDFKCNRMGKKFK